MPFTPTMRTTAGTPLCGETCSDRSMSSPSWPSSSARSSARTSAGPARPEDLDLGAQVVDHQPGGRHAHVGRDQHLFDLVPGLVVEPVPGQQAQQRRPDRTLGPGQPGPQPHQPPRRRRRPLEIEHGGRGLRRGCRRVCRVLGAACPPPPGVGGGATGGWPGGAEMVRPRRGRTNSSHPPVTTARTAMTTMRITYSIRLTVSQTPPCVASGGVEARLVRFRGVSWRSGRPPTYPRSGPFL